MGDMQCFTCRTTAGFHTEECRTHEAVTVRLRDRDGMGAQRRAASAYLQTQGRFLPSLYKAGANESRGA